MKTVWISLLTFAVGLGAGVFIPPRERVGEKERAKTPAVQAAAPSQSQRAKTSPSADAVPSAVKPAGDPFAEWDAALKAGSLTDTRLRSTLLARMAEADPARAWRALMSSGLPVTRAETDSVAEAWYEKDALGAANFALTLTDPLQRPAFLRQVLYKWLREKPGAFARWFNSQPEELNLGRYLSASSMTYRLGLCTLEDMDALLLLAPRWDSFPDFIGLQLGALWSQPEQRQAATDWLRRVTDSHIRDALWKQLVARASPEDPQAATRMLAEISDDKSRRQASSTISAHLAKQDPQTALDFAASLADPEASQHAWRSALCTWAAQDSQKALDYIRQNMARLTPEMLDPAGSALGESRPAEALAVVAGFPASVDRSSLINNVMSTWRNRQPVESRRWLEGGQGAAILPAADLEYWRASLAADAASQRPMGMSTTINGRRVNYSY